VAAEQSAEPSAEQNILSAKAGFAASSWGDPAAAMANMADDVECVVPGNSTVSGTYHGKEELGAFWMKLAEKSYTEVAELFLGDEERVMVLIHMTIAGESSDRVDVLTYRDGKVVKVQSVLDTLFLQQIFGTK
jgi:ketosteroid isomerase-like protein